MILKFPNLGEDKIPIFNRDKSHNEKTIARGKFQPYMTQEDANLNKSMSEGARD